MTWYDKTIYDLFGLRNVGHKVEGEVGIEIELEGLNLPAGAMQYYWNAHNDGSLRPFQGHNPQEYTLKRAISRDDVLKSLEYLKKKLTSSFAEVQLSQRTSVHVHVNAQELSFRQVMTWLTLYYIFEEVLTDYVGGKLRSGNLFCLRLKDAENVLNLLGQSLKNQNVGYLNDPEHLKYHACNVAALASFGSLEFRQHRGCDNPTDISRWVSILLRLKDASLEYDNPQDVVREFSQKGLQVFCQNVFRDFNYLLWRIPDFQAKLWEGLRLAQDLAYAIPVWAPKGEGKIEEKKEREPGGWDAEFDGALAAGRLDIQAQRPMPLRHRFVDIHDLVPPAPVEEEIRVREHDRLRERIRAAELLAGIGLNPNGPRAPEPAPQPQPQPPRRRAARPRRIFDDNL
jgi:hypothetical protein